MKKLFAIAMLSLVSSFAFAASSAALQEYQPAPAAQSPTSATDKAAPTALENGAAKLGSFFGGILMAPAKLGKAFAGGVGAGITGAAAPAIAPPQTASTKSSTKLAEWKETPPAVAVNSESAVAKHPLAAALSALIRFPKPQDKAPVEERSAPASAAERQPLASTL